MSSVSSPPPTASSVSACPAVVGVVGAGQLGRMLHQAAVSNLIGSACAVRFLAERADDPAAQVSASIELGSAASAADLVRFASGCDVMTFEHELVDLAGVRACEATGCAVRPGADVLAVVADKVAMRRAVVGVGLPSPAWTAAVDADGLDRAIEAMGGRVVLKPSRGGYDGRGVFVPSTAADAQETGRRLLAAGAEVLVETFVPFVAEAAVVVARRPSGASVAYDPVRTVQIDGQCREVRAPSGLGADVDARCRTIALDAAAALGVVGLLAVELFVLGDGAVLVNELAVRPHNSAHHTIDACVTSQFEQHLRAVLDLPLGDPSLRSPAAVMVNVIGGTAGDDPSMHLAEALAIDPSARVHLYGKAVRPDRKVGHVTVCDQDVDRAAARAWAVVAALRGDVPDRSDERMGRVP